MKKDFPIFNKYPELVYLDSACTTLKPNSVIEAELVYYKEFSACGGRSSHFLARATNEKIDVAREIIAKFVKAKNIVFTRNATEALNIVIRGFVSERKKIITTIMEHHAVLLPLMYLRDQKKIELEILSCNEFGEVNWDEKIDKKTALIVTNNANNTTGYCQDVEKIAKIAHDNGSKICIDGAQGVPHKKVDASKFDYLCFSAHKMLGPTGIGALSINDVNDIEPFVFGGGIVRSVKTDKYDLVKDITKYEAGIQNYAGIFGFAEACSYLQKIGMEKVEEHEKKMVFHLEKALDGITVYGKRHDTALFSFNLGDKPHDVALMLDKEKICVRSGFFCAEPGMNAIGAKNGAVRASAYLYNDESDIQKFQESLEKIKVLY